jgi:hypothetical protein
VPVAGNSPQTARIATRRHRIIIAKIHLITGQSLKNGPIAVAFLSSMDVGDWKSAFQARSVPSGREKVQTFLNISTHSERAF